MYLRPTIIGVILCLLVAGWAGPAAISAHPATRPLPTFPASWSNLSTPRSPPSAAGTMMAYDANASRFVWFGGWNGAVPLNQTWELNDANSVWTQLAPRTAPPPRADAALTYDPLDQLFYLFGGWSQYPNGSVYRLNDTWAYSLAFDRWTELFPPVAPSPRSDAAVAFGPAQNAILLFGGFSGTTYLGDTWSYSPPQGTWTQRSPGATSPGPRADGRMNYDSATNQFVLFGGNDYSGPNLTFHHLNDTWTFQYGGPDWSQILTLRAPPARDYAVQAFDPASGWILLFGGFGNRTILNDLWAFDPGNSTWWPLLAPSAPPPRYAGAGGFDDANLALVIVGGLGGTGLLNDTWALGMASPSGSSALFPWMLVLEVGVPLAIVVAALALWARRSRR